MKRVCYLGLGHICVILGIIGIILPVMPGTVFFVIGSWAYSRSSETFQRMLHQHPRIGPPLLAWEQHRVISPRAKIIIGIAMVVSFGLCLMRAHSWHAPTITGTTLLLVYSYLVTRPSHIPHVPHESYKTV